MGNLPLNKGVLNHLDNFRQKKIKLETFDKISNKLEILIKFLSLLKKENLYFVNSLTFYQLGGVVA